MRSSPHRSSEACDGSRVNVRGLIDLMKALTATGELDRAEAIARSVPGPYREAEALVVLVEDLAAVGDIDRAEAVARSITHPDSQAQALIALVKAHIAAGDIDRAEDVVRSMTDEPVPPRRRSNGATCMRPAAPLVCRNTLSVSANGAPPAPVEVTFLGHSRRESPGPFASREG